MASADGTWNVTLNSPMGTQAVVLDLKTDGGALSGEAETPFGDQRFDDGTIEGDDLSWSVKVKSPIPMNVKFTATVEGDAITGTAVAGPFGTFDFEGTRE